MHTQFTHSNSYFIDRCALHLFFINDGCERSGDDSKCANLLEKRSKPAKKKKEPTKKKTIREIAGTVKVSKCAVLCIMRKRRKIWHHKNAGGLQKSAQNVHTCTQCSIYKCAHMNEPYILPSTL